MPSQTSTTTATTLLELVQQQAVRLGDKVAFSFSYNGDDVDRTEITYAGLDMRARAIAADLQRRGAGGQPVLVLWRPGLDCLAGYFGCLYAGAIVVPVDEHWASRRVAAVVPDSGARFALATPETRAKIRKTVDAIVEEPLHWCVTEVPDEAADDWTEPTVDADTHAMIQYSSGSTRTPHGIILTHDNLIQNLRMIRQAWDPPAADPLFDESASTVTGVSWMPHHHDMGLIGGVLAPIESGFTIELMAPGAFLMRPMNWLRAMSRTRAMVTAAPNFAYDLCVQRSTPDQRAELDLSNWKIAVSGGEPVQAATIDNFAEAFAPAGFRVEAFLPAYGLAEATLGVSGVEDTPAPMLQHIDRAALEENRVVDAPPEDPTTLTLVSCGEPRGQQDVIIVDPDTQRLRGPDEVGEIWIAGPCVAQGYWRRPDETERLFNAHLADTGAGPYLRTGDLGFFRFGEMFIAGRLKDLVIIRGKNYYPNDIEITVQETHPVLVRGRGAVFSITHGRRIAQAEQLVVVQEVDRHMIDEVDTAEVIDGIRAAIKEHHGIEPQDVLLVKPLRIPTTTSGKIQRYACRQKFLEEALEPVAEWHAPPVVIENITDSKQPEVALKLARVIAKGLIQQRRRRRQG